MDVLEIAQRNQTIAWKIVEDMDVVSIWNRVGATVNMVGSLKSGLLMKNRDIDFHIYTDRLVIADSFSAMEKLAENPRIKEVQYRNLIDTEEECIEWHAWYEDDEKNMWQIDMIHILRGSAYDGWVERVTDAIIGRLTPETREAILWIKYNTPDNIKVPGIEVYRGVFSGGVRSYDEFVEWQKNNPIGNTLDWMP